MSTHLAMSPIVVGMTMTRYRRRHRWAISAKPRSPWWRNHRRSALWVRASMPSSARTGFRLAVKTDLGSRIVRAWAIVPTAVSEGDVAADLLETGQACRVVSCLGCFRWAKGVSQRRDRLITPAQTLTGSPDQLPCRPRNRPSPPARLNLNRAQAYERG